MNLTAKQFATIARALAENQAKLVGDHRRSPRVEQRGTVVVLLLGDERKPPELAGNSFLSMQVRNISNRGIGLTHDEALERGRQLVLHLNAEQQSPLRLLCTVVHCKRINAETSHLGCEFTCVLQDESKARSKPKMDNDVQRIQRSILN